MVRTWIRSPMARQTAVPRHRPARFDEGRSPSNNQRVSPPPTFASVEMKTVMPVFDFPRITILPDGEGRKMVRATVVNQRTRATMTIWEYIDGARMLESNFARFRRTRFSAPLKRFLLADLDADVVARLIKNGGYEARLTERYRELLTDLELRLASSFSTPATRVARGRANPANP